jgi:hypothetical protein
MISYEVYKVLHLLGIFMIVTSVSAMCLQATTGEVKEHSWKKFLFTIHGLGMFLSLLGGFGLMARLGLAHSEFPIWIKLKLIIWVGFGFFVYLLIKKRNSNKLIWLLNLAFVTVAAFLAVNKI